MHDELLCGVLLSTKIDQQLKFDNIVKKKNENYNHAEKPYTNLKPFGFL